MFVGDVAVINKYPLPAIVFDFGTATTASVIDKTGAHIGGAIMCGVKTAINSLASGTAQLPQIDISAPSKIIGRNTIDAISADLLSVRLLCLRGLWHDLKRNWAKRQPLLPTGGLGKAIAKATNLDVIVDDNLLIDGLNNL